MVHRLTTRRERADGGGGRLRRASTVPLRYGAWRGLAALLGLVPMVLGGGFREPVVPMLVVGVLQAVLLAVYALLLYLDDRRVRALTPERHAEFRQIARPEIAACAVGLVGAWYWPVAAAAAGFVALVFLTRSYIRLTQMSIPSGLVFVGSFVALIAVGTAALKLPAATHPEAPITTLDACFTVTSAISQTGLIVRQTGALIDETGARVIGADGEVVPGFTRFGQVVILVWMQVGALGVIVFGALFAQLAGSGFGFKAAQGLGDATEQGWAGQLSTQRLVTFIIVVTHLFQLVGAVVIFFGLPATWEGAPYDMETLGDRVYHSVFLSVSAFCNAGFVTTDGSLYGLRAHWVPHLVVVPLIVIGSLGFGVLENVWRVFVARVRRVRVDAQGALVRINLHTKIVLWSSLLLYLLGFATILLGEVVQTEERLPVELLDAHFMNMNRTSGFNTIDPADMGILAQLVTMFLMFVGGAPASVAGGIKVVVLSVLLLAVWSALRGREDTTAFGRTISDLVLKKCVAVIVLFLVGILVVTAALVVTESGRITPSSGVGGTLLPILFEVVSAFATCGLSLGITPDLSPFGRVMIIVSMFIGRVGFLALLASIVALALGSRGRASYPHEPVTVY